MNAKRGRHNQEPARLPKGMKPDGLDIEFSQELADEDDLKAQARSRAADARAKRRIQQ